MMKLDGSGDTGGCAMSITSAVAILFSVSWSDTCPRSDLHSAFCILHSAFCILHLARLHLARSLRRHSVGRTVRTKVRTKLLATLFLFFGGCVIYFYAAPRTQCAQNFVAAGYDFVAILKSFDDFDVGGGGDSGVDGHEFGFMIAQDEDALNFFFVFIVVFVFRRIVLRRRLHRSLFIFGNQVFLAANG